jgi:hypothetical protein
MFMTAAFGQKPSGCIHSCYDQGRVAVPGRNDRYAVWGDKITHDSLDDIKKFGFISTGHECKS